MELGVEHESLMQVRRENLLIEIGHFPLNSFWKQSYEGYPTLGWDVHLDLALPSSHGFNIV